MFKIEILGAKQERPIGPRDCSLLVAVPVTRERFIEDLTATNGKEFVRSFGAGSRRNLSSDGLWLAYKPYAEYMQRVADEVSRLGVAVTMDAQFNAFIDQLTSREVTTLVAHWRTARFRPSDILDPARLHDIWCNLLQRPVPDGLAELRNACPVRLPTDLLTAQKSMAAALNALLPEVPPTSEHGKPPDEQTPSGGEAAEALFRQHATRQKLEECFPGCFGVGSAVEFADGLRSLEEAVQAIPEHFAGILDLMVCNSILLGEAVRRKCPHSVAMMNVSPATPEIRFSLYRHTIRYLASKASSYIDAAILVRNKLGRIQ